MEASKYLRSISVQPITINAEEDVPGYELKLVSIALRGSGATKKSEPFIIAESDLLALLKGLLEQVHQVQVEQGRAGH